MFIFDHSRDVAKSLPTGIEFTRKFIDNVFVNDKSWEENAQANHDILIGFSRSRRFKVGDLVEDASSDDFRNWRDVIDYFCHVSDADAKAFKLHAANGTQSFEEYVGEAHNTLHNYMLQQFKIYLDMKFWITLANTIMGMGPGQSVSLLDAVRASRPKVLYPSSATIFLELMKQSSPTSRSVIAGLFDELSEGIVLIDPPQQADMEMQTCLERPSRPENAPRDVPVWTKIGCVLGPPMGTSPALPRHVELVLQKAFFDKFWRSSSREFVVATGGMKPEYFDQTAETINQMNAARGRPKSFRDAYIEEVADVTSLYAKDANDHFVRKMRRLNLMPKGILNEEIAAGEKAARAAITSGLVRGYSQKRLPFIHITASLFAALWTNFKKKATPNDVYDYFHAAGC
jgi:hypothetical protein